MEILQNTILKLVFRQGTDSDRQQIILTRGEPGWTTDTGRLFVGDGILSGGILVGNLFKGFHTSVTAAFPAEVGDFVFNTDSNSLFILQTGDGSNTSDWEQVGGVYTGSTFIDISNDNEISLNSLSANIFDLDAVESPITISNGRIALSAKIPFERVSTNTITISSGLQAFDINDVDVTNQAINPLSSNITVRVGQLSARMFSYDAVGRNLTVDEDGRLALSATIDVDVTNTVTFSNGLSVSVDGVNFSNTPFNLLAGNIVVGVSLNNSLVNFPLSVVDNRLTLPTRTITVSSGLLGYVNGVDVTNTTVNPLTGDLIVRIGQLSAGMISSDALNGNMVLNNGRIALSTTIPFQYVSTTTISVSNGVSMFVQTLSGLSAANAVNSLSANIVLMGTDVLANYAGLSGQTLLYSRGLLSVIRLSAGDYNFLYNVPTNNVYPIVQIYSNVNPGLLARAVFFNLSTTKVNIVSANDFNIKRDANVIFKLSY